MWQNYRIERYLMANIDLQEAKITHSELVTYLRL
jgi:hypothetical protein